VNRPVAVVIAFAASCSTWDSLTTERMFLPVDVPIYYGMTISAAGRYRVVGAFYVNPKMGCGGDLANAQLLYVTASGATYEPIGASVVRDNDIQGIDKEIDLQAGTVALGAPAGTCLFLVPTDVRLPSREETICQSTTSCTPWAAASSVGYRCRSTHRGSVDCFSVVPSLFVVPVSNAEAVPSLGEITSPSEWSTRDEI
jgi:hypothetical protein